MENKCIHWHLFLLCDRIKLPTSQKKQEGCWQHIIILYPFCGQKYEFFREIFNPFNVIRILVCYNFAWIRSVSNVLTGPWRAKVIIKTQNSLHGTCRNILQTWEVRVFFISFKFMISCYECDHETGKSFKAY